MKIYIYLIFGLFPMIASGQEKIEGIGKFKIGKTPVSITEEIAKETGDKINIMDEYLNMGTERFRIGEIIVNKTYPDRSPEQASFCPGVRIFQISTYQISGVTLNNIILTFKDDILISLMCDGSADIGDALKLKYGSPVLKTEKKKVDCLYTGTGNKLQLEEAKYWQNWSNGKVVATLYTAKQYTKQCSEYITESFVIRDPSILATVIQCDSAIKAKSEAKKKESQRKDLKDF